MGFDFVLFSTINQKKKTGENDRLCGILFRICRLFFSIAKSLELQMAKEMKMKTGNISLYNIFLSGIVFKLCVVYLLLWESLAVLCALFFNLSFSLRHCCSCWKFLLVHLSHSYAKDLLFAAIWGFSLETAIKHYAIVKLIRFTKRKWEQYQNTFYIYFCGSLPALIQRKSNKNRSENVEFLTKSHRTRIVWEKLTKTIESYTLMCS